MNMTPIMTSKFIADELYKMALDVVDYNNEIVGTEDVTAFHPMENGAFYINKDTADELLLMETKDHGEREVMKITHFQLEALFKLYENVKDHIGLEGNKQ